MFTKSLFLTLAVLAASVNAQTSICSITAPLQGTQWTAGQSAIISWINASVATFTEISLEQGNPSALSPVGVLASNVPTAPGQYSFVVPSNLPAGTTYALVLGTQPNVCYSPEFSIVAGSGTPAATSAGNSTAPATSTSGAATSPVATSSAAISAIATTSAAVGTSISLASVSSASPVSTNPSSSSSAPASSSSSTTTKSAAVSNTVQVRVVLGAIGVVGLVMMTL